MKVSGYSKKEKMLQKFFRVGFAAKGLVYCLFSLLALLSAAGHSQRQGNKEEAFKLIHEQPFGQVILIVIGVSLLGFVALRLLQAINREGKDRSDAKGIFQRLGKAVSALIYLSISLYSFRLALRGQSEEGDSRQMMISKVLEFDAGQFIIGAAALIVIGQGLYQVFRGATAAFMKKVKLQDSSFRETFQKIGVAGFISRGIVLCVLGYFLARAALQSNLQEAQGTERVFSFLEDKGGIWLLAVIAAGLFAYGIFMFVRARHEKISIKWRV